MIAMGGPGKSASSPATLYFPCGNLSKPLGAMALNVLTLNEAPAYPPEADDPDDDDEEALIAALLSFSFLFLASSSIFSSMSISSLLEDDDALMIVPFREPILLRWNCAFFCFEEEEEEIKADDLAEQAA
jgi:hypothetical protein